MKNIPRSPRRLIPSTTSGGSTRGPSRPATNEAGADRGRPPFLGPGEAAVVRYWLGPKRTDRRLASLVSAADSQARCILTGKRRLPRDIDFESLGRGPLRPPPPVLPAEVPASIRSLPVIALSDDELRVWSEDEDQACFVHPRAVPIDRPTFHVGLDRIVLLATLDRDEHALLGRIRALCNEGPHDPYVEKFILDDGHVCSLRFEHVPISYRTSEGSKRFHHAYHHGANVYLLRVAEPPKLIAQVHALPFAPRCEEHAGIKEPRRRHCRDCVRNKLRHPKRVHIELTGEAFANDLALPFVRRYFHPFVVPGSVAIRSADVAFDLGLHASDLIPLHAPASARSALSAIGHVHLGRHQHTVTGYSGREVVLYDKILEFFARDRSLPRHLRGWVDPVARIEARIWLSRRRGCKGAVEDILGEIGKLADEIQVADLARHTGPGLTSRILELARRHGITARPHTERELARRLAAEPSVRGDQAVERALRTVLGSEVESIRAKYEASQKEMGRRSEGPAEPPRGETDLLGFVCAEFLRCGYRWDRAYAEALLIHAWAVERVRDLAAKTPWSLREMFDLAVPTTIEPVLRALTDANGA